MKKISLIVLAILFIFINLNTSFSQLKIVLGPAIGLTTPSGDYGGETTEYYAGTKYGLKPGINFGAMGKLGLGPINFNLSVIYSPLSNSGASDPGKPGSTVEIEQNLLTIGVGSQYGFGLPLSPVKPYIGLDILFTSISGSVNFQGGTPEVSNSKYNMQSASRTGLGIAGGVEIKLLSTTIDASIRYNMINLFSKSFEGANNSDRNESYKYLNDAKDPNYAGGDKKHPIGSDRTIATLNFQLGILFGF
jgi:hypothetical protein